MAATEKARSNNGSQTDSSSPGSSRKVLGQYSDGELDQAYWFMQELNSTPIEEGTALTTSKALRRKIDWWIIPICFACYTMQFLDKVLLNYAAVMGLNKDLKLVGNDFTNAATAFFIAYLIAEIPNAYFLQKIPVAKWLALNVSLWGVVTACTAAASDYRGLLIARIFLGILEAAIAPSLTLLSSQWYTKSEAAPRFSIWYGGLGLGQILGGLVSYAFQQVEHPQLAGWRIMFLALGGLTIIIGLTTALILPDTPMNASFLSEAEKVALIKHVSVNQTGIHGTKFKVAHIWEMLLDLQIWLLTLITILTSVSSGVITTYSATIIRNLGFKPPIAALLNMPSGIVSITSALVVGFGIRFTSNRWAWIIACCIPGILGGGLLSFAPRNNIAALLAGVYLVNAITAVLVIIYQWTAANVAGHTKRVVSVALVAGSFSVGNIIGPQTFQAKDAPDYLPAKITVLAAQAAAALMAGLLALYYVMANRGKEKAVVGSVEQDERHLWKDLTDRENKAFRYVY